MFRSCENKGFQMEFSNGYKISCQFGAFSYCSRRCIHAKCGEERKMLIVESKDCEIAIFKNVEWVTSEILDNMGLEIPNDGMVAGWVSADNVGKIIGYLAGLKG